MAFSPAIMRGGPNRACLQYFGPTTVLLACPPKGPQRDEPSRRRMLLEAPMVLKIWLPQSAIETGNPDVVKPCNEVAIFQAGFQLVISRRSREASSERRLSGLDQLDWTSDLLSAVGRRQDFVVVLLAAEAAADQTFMHEDLEILGASG